MHAAAFEWVRHAAGVLPRTGRICEFGSRDVNGSVRELFGESSSYVGIDVTGGPGVNLIADAATWGEPAAFDIILCTEMLEHSHDPAAVCANALRLLRPAGVFVVTCAAADREPHSAVDGGALREGETYQRIQRDDLRTWLWPFAAMILNAETPGDLYALAIKGS